jgi:hypothetical protein
MTTQLNAMLSGTFVSAGTLLPISLPTGYDSIELLNITDIGSAAAATPVMKARGTSAMASGSAYYSTKTNGAATCDLEITTATGGFTFVQDSGALGLGANVAITAISQAASAVVNTGTTPLVGSVVRIYSPTSMLQAGGIDYTVTATNPGVTMTLGYLNSAGFAAAATGGSYRTVPTDPRFYPRARTITAISQAASAVIQLSVTHGYTVGQKVRILCSAAYGMTEIDGQLATITAINTGTNTITVNIDSSGYSAFAYPTSAVAALGTTPPQIIPIGEAAVTPYGNLLDDATINLSFSGVVIGTTVQTTGKTYQWFARRGQAI